MNHNLRYLVPALLAAGTPFAPVAVAADQDVDLGEYTVTGTREQVLRSETPAAVGAVDSRTIEETRPAHPTEVMGRIPGVHVNVTNGEGHMTAIRQPMSTGAVYLYLENGIPTRSTGFFNHNALYEVNIPQASGIEVTRGPGTALYGSDALGGVINVFTPAPPAEGEGQVNAEVGEHGWWRLMASAGNSWDQSGVRGDINLTHTDGWREGTEYDRQSSTLRWDRFLDDGARLRTVLSVSDIDQQTAGTSRLSEDDYKNDPTKNYYVISYRDVQALRLSTAYEKETADTLLSITPYLRRNEMEYMPNWSFSYDPVIRKTENDSFGVQFKYRMDFVPNRTRVVVGTDVDYSPGGRLEHSIDAVQTGDVFTDYTVTDKVYDYDVTFRGISPYIHVETSPTERLRLQGGLRYDDLQYDYDNQMADGALTLLPPPASMGFPPTYEHPSDTKVDFSHLSPKLGATYAFSQNLSGYASYRHAFRAPSEGKLFRPGSNQASLDLDPVKVDSYELGLRGESGRLSYDLAVYYMTKEDDLVTFEDTNGDRYTVNAGETLHKGVEVGAGVEISDAWQLDASFSYTEHTYEDWVEKGKDYSGNDIQQAPETIGNTRLSYRPAAMNGGKVELEWKHLGEYWMDPDNTETYDGHDLLNLRANYPTVGGLEVYGRIMNLTDERYATRSRYSRGAKEFAPGLPRTVYAGVNYRF